MLTDGLVVLRLTNHPFTSLRPGATQSKDHSQLVLRTCPGCVKRWCSGCVICVKSAGDQDGARCYCCPDGKAKDWGPDGVYGSHFIANVTEKLKQEHELKEEQRKKEVEC